MPMSYPDSRSTHTIFARIGKRWVPVMVTPDTLSYCKYAPDNVKAEVIMDVTMAILRRSSAIGLAVNRGVIPQTMKRNLDKSMKDFVSNALEDANQYYPGIEDKFFREAQS